jgi:hypothetical protein
MFRLWLGPTKGQDIAVCSYSMFPMVKASVKSQMALGLISFYFNFIFHMLALTILLTLSNQILIVWSDLLFFGFRYDGYWENGLREGCGRVIDARGSIYEGYFIGDVPHGLGVITNLTGHQVHMYSFVTVFEYASMYLCACTAFKL